MYTDPRLIDLRPWISGLATLVHGKVIMAGGCHKKSEWRLPLSGRIGSRGRVNFKALIESGQLLSESILQFDNGSRGLSADPGIVDVQCYSLFQRTIATTMALLRSRAALPLHVCGTGERRTSDSELHDRFMRISMFRLVRRGRAPRKK